MRRLLYIFMLLAVSCGKDNPLEPITPSDKVEAKIVTDQGSRAAVNGNSFAKGSTVGVFLYKSDDTTSHTSDANLNIKTTYNASNEWVYCFSYSLSTDHSSITLDREDGTAKCYAYYPHTYLGPNPETIPINMSSQYDLMYARNENIEMPDAMFDTDVKIDLTFEHALSSINFNFRLKNVNQGTVQLEGMQFVADTDIMTEGTLNIKEPTPALTVKKKASEFSSSLNSSSYVTITDSLNYGMLIPPTFGEKVAYKVYLTINGVKMQTPIEIPPTIYKAGTSYTVKATIGNYAKFDGIRVDEDWVYSDTYLGHTI